MKLTVSRIAGINAPEGVSDDVVGRVVSMAATHAASAMQLVGVSRISLGNVKSLSCDSHVISSYDFFEGAPDMIVSLSQRTIEAIGKFMSGFGIGSIEMTLDEGDGDKLKSLWSSVEHGSNNAKSGSADNSDSASAQEPEPKPKESVAVEADERIDAAKSQASGKCRGRCSSASCGSKVIRL